MPVHGQPAGVGAATRCGDDQRAVAAHPDDGPLGPFAITQPAPIR
jgi:hypothetical protein